MKIINHFILFWIRQQNILGLIARKLNLQQFLDYSLFPEKAIVKIDNYTFDVDIKDYLGSQLYAYNIYERTTLHHLLPLIQPNDTVIDIGANIGLYSILIGSRLKNGFVHSFEPVSLNYKRLQKNIDLNHLHNITLVQKGISNSVSSKEIYIYAHNMMASNFFTDKTGEHETIELTSLDTYCAEQNLRTINIIKVDIEGAEMDFLRGAEKTIQSQKDLVLVIEFSPQIIQKSGNTAEAMYAKIISMGFDIYTPRELPWKKPHRVTHFNEISNMEGNLICIKGTRSFL